MARALYEYPFLQNQSGMRSEAYGQLSHPHLPDPIVDGPTRTPPFVVGNEQLPRIHASQGHSSRHRLILQDKQGIPYLSPPQDDDGASQRDSITNLADIRTNSHFTDHPIAGPENPYALSLSSGQTLHNDAMLRMERKRKVSSSYI